MEEKKQDSKDRFSNIRNQLKDVFFEESQDATQNDDKLSQEKPSRSPKKKLSQRTIFPWINLKNKPKTTSQEPDYGKRNQIPQYIFNKEQQKWILDENEHKKDINGVKNVSILTYNVWYNQTNFEERVAEILQMIHKASVDFICLQEVTLSFLQDLFKESESIKDYYISANVIGEYGNMIMSKFPCSMYETILPTNMGRTMVTVLANINGAEFAVSSIHLESYSDNAEIRDKQINVVMKDQQEYKQNIVCGDFNFDDEESNSRLAAVYTDIWPALNDLKVNPGHTMKATKEFKAWRPDKVYLKSTDNKLKPVKIELIGTEQISKYRDPIFKMNPPDYLVLTPSDHLGLITQFELQ